MELGKQNTCSSRGPYDCPNDGSCTRLESCTPRDEHGPDAMYCSFLDGEEVSAAACKPAVCGPGGLSPWPSTSCRQPGFALLCSEGDDGCACTRLCSCKHSCKPVLPASCIAAIRICLAYIPVMACLSWTCFSTTPPQLDVLHHSGKYPYRHRPGKPRCPNPAQPHTRPCRMQAVCSAAPECTFVPQEVLDYQGPGAAECSQAYALVAKEGAPALVSAQHFCARLGPCRQPKCQGPNVPYCEWRAAARVLAMQTGKIWMCWDCTVHWSLPSSTISWSRPGGGHPATMS